MKYPKVDKILSCSNEILENVYVQKITGLTCKHRNLKQTVEILTSDLAIVKGSFTALNTNTKSYKGGGNSSV